MRRFLKGVVSGLVPVMVIGAIALAALGDVDGDAVTSAEVMTQVEDDAGEEANVDAAPGAALTPIEAYLAKVLPDAEGGGLPSTQRVVLSRDPFNPVVPTDAGGTPDGGTTDGDGTDGDGTDGDGTDGDGTDGDGDGTDGDVADKCLGDEAEQVCADDERGTFVVTLEGFTDDGLVRVTVEGTTYTVGVDEDFALHFRVVAINDPCATLLFGDEAFSICTGATVLK